MSEEMLVCHCSPTLAGLKTGSLFSCPYSSQKMIIKEIREFNQKLTQKGSGLSRFAYQTNGCWFMSIVQKS